VGFLKNLSNLSNRSTGFRTHRGDVGRELVYIALDPIEPRDYLSLVDLQ
jgi:hypothetical protein